jgi:hypothetical protein
MWELDLYSRFHKDHGAETRFVDGICRETSEQNVGQERLSVRTWNVDRKLFLELWNVEAYLEKRESELKRAGPLVPYDIGSLTSTEQN